MTDLNKCPCCGLAFPTCDCPSNKIAQEIDAKILKDLEWLLMQPPAARFAIDISTRSWFESLRHFMQTNLTQSIAPTEEDGAARSAQAVSSTNGENS